MEAFLKAWLPRFPVPSFQIITFQGKSDLLGKIESQMRALATWIPADWRIVVIVDRDDDDCKALKTRLEAICANVGVATRRAAPGHWVGATCIAIEELEAWYFGNWPAVVAAYPRVPANIPNRAAFRQPDAIAEGTWEAFERVMQRAGYFKGGLQKTKAARDIGAHVDGAVPGTSASFNYFIGILAEAMA